MRPGYWRACLLLAALATVPAVARTAPAPVQGFDPDLLHRNPDGSFYLSVRDSEGIFDAMERGDRDALQRIRARLDGNGSGLTDSPLPDLCDAALARVNGDLDGADLALDRLSRRLGALGDPERSINPMDLMIDLFRSGNQLLRGDLHSWAGTQERLQRQYFAPVRAAYHLPDLEFRNADLIRLAVPAATLARPTVSEPASDTLPFTRWTRSLDNKPLLDIAATVSIDGSPVQAVFDTDSTTGSLPRSFVAAHGLPVIGHSGAMSDGTGRVFPEDFVLVRSLSIGHAVLTNQMFSVTGIEQPILGLQQLAGLRHLTMTAHGVSFGSAAPFPCEEPLTISSLRGGFRAGLMLPLTIDGDIRIAEFDSGDNTPDAVTIRGPGMPDRLAGHLIDESFESIAGRSLHKIAIDRTRMSIGHLTLVDTVKYVPGETSMAPTISSHVLRNATLRLDMVEHKACLD